jgi:hypothetical protein
MSDAHEVKTGLVARMKRWISGRIIKEVPSDMATCEFHCRELDCSRGDWDTCEDRLRGKRSGNTGRLEEYKPG